MYHDPKLNGGAYLLTWNPKRWDRLNLRSVVRDFNRDNLGEFEWATGNRKTLQPGGLFFFLKQGTDDAGILGWGRIRSQGYRTKHWDSAKARNGELSNEVLVTFDFLGLESDPRCIPRTILRSDRRTLAGNWDTHSSGIRLSPKVTEGVRQLFRERRVLMPKLDDLPPITQFAQWHFIEGLRKQVLTTYHERNAGARAECIRIYGCRCQACDFDFGLQYGPDADGMIEVHHRNPISQAGENARVCPKRDLVPLCANCHRAIHMKGKNEEPLTLQKLRALIRKHGNGYGDARS